MPAVDFFGPSTRDDANRWVSSQRLVNLYRETVNGAPVLRSVLGMEVWATLPDQVFCRTMAVAVGQLYAIYDDRLYRVSSAGNLTEVGTVENSDVATIDSNNGLVTVASGGRYFVHDPDGLTLTEPGGGAFDAVGDAVFYAQRTVRSELNGRRIDWTALADATDLDGSFATAEARDDSILRLLPIGGALWVFKERSIEMWAATATGVAAIPGAVRDRGLKARNLLVGFPDGAFYIGQDGKAYVAGGMDAAPVSVVAVESAIAAETPERVVYWRDRGHEFCAIVFRHRPAWVYDLSTGEWHERATDEGAAWRVRATVFAYGAWRAGSDAAAIYTLVGVPMDAGQPMIRRAISSTLKQGDRFRVKRAIFEATVGLYRPEDEYRAIAVLGTGGTDVLEVLPDSVLEIDALQSQPRQAVMDMRTSGDNGQTWGHFRPLRLGLVGRMDMQPVAHALGQFRQVTVEVRLSEPYDVTIGGRVDLELA